MYMPHIRRKWVHKDGQDIWTYAIITFKNAKEAEKIDVRDSFSRAPHKIEGSIHVYQILYTMEHRKFYTWHVLGCYYMFFFQ